MNDKNETSIILDAVWLSVNGRKPLVEKSSYCGEFTHNGYSYGNGSDTRWDNAAHM